MKLRFKLFTAFVLLFAASVWAGKWTIDSFDDSPDPGDPDKFIDGDLNPVPPGQVSQQSNTLYVRQKFEDTFGDDGALYQIFKGRPTAEAKSLGKISLDGIPYGTLLKMKLFYKRNATGDDDLETVYFDGKDILVEGGDPVYINLNGKMEELKPVITAKDYKVSIASEPSGATVTVGGASKGSTPVTFSFTKPITAVITKEGYYTIVKPITPSNKQTQDVEVSLTGKKSLDNPATAYKSQLQTAMSNKNTSAVKSLRADVKKTLDNYNSDSKKSIEAVMSKYYPPNLSKVSEESSNDYSARQTIYNNAQAKEREALNKEALGIFNELKDLVAEIDAAAKDLEQANAAAAKPKPQPKKQVVEEEDDAEYDEEEDEEEVAEGVAAQEKYDYSRYGATGNATQIFGNTDEYLFWTGMVFLAGAITNGVFAFWNNNKYSDANDAYTHTYDKRKSIIGDIEGTCIDSYPDDSRAQEKCKKIAVYYAEGKDANGFSNFPEEHNGENIKQAVTDGRPLWLLKPALDKNKATKDSYDQARIIFFSASAVSLAISIALFAW